MTKKVQKKMLEGFWKWLIWFTGKTTVRIMYSFLIYVPISFIIGLFKIKYNIRPIHPSALHRYLKNRLEGFTEHTDEWNELRINKKRSHIESIRSRIAWLEKNGQSEKAILAEKERITQKVVEHLERHSDWTIQKDGRKEACAKVLDDIDVDLRNEAIALAHVVLCRTVEIKELHDNQLNAILLMIEGKFIELRNGEGKTFVAVPVLIWAAIRLQALRVFTDRNEIALPFSACFLLTSNDYLVRRDFVRLKKVYESLGISVSYIVASEKMHSMRRTAYQAEVIFIRGSEYGFDYLRNASRSVGEDRLGKDPYMVLVDEADQLLVDEARTPLILSGYSTRRFSAYIEAAWVQQINLWVEIIFKDNSLLEKTSSGQYYLTTAGRIYFRSLLNEKEANTWAGFADLIRKSGWLPLIIILSELFSIVPHLRKQMTTEALSKLKALLDRRGERILKENRNGELAIDKDALIHLIKLYEPNIRVYKGLIREVLDWLFEEVNLGKFSDKDLAAFKTIKKRRLASIILKQMVNKSYIVQVLEILIKEVAQHSRRIQLPTQFVDGLILLTEEMHVEESTRSQLQPPEWVTNYGLSGIINLSLPTLSKLSGTSVHELEGTKRDLSQVIRSLSILGNLEGLNLTRNPVVRDAMQSFVILGALFRNFLFFPRSGRLTDAGRRVAAFLEHYCIQKGLAENYSRGGIVDLIGRSLFAHRDKKRDKEYIIENGKIILVNQMSGRREPGKHFGRSLHPFVQAKHGLQIEEPLPTIRTITIQSLFQKVPRLIGMSGTLLHEERELRELYAEDVEEPIVVYVPPRITPRLEQLPARLVWNKRRKWAAIIEEIFEVRSRNSQPILVITPSVEDSNTLAMLLRKAIENRSSNLVFNVLNASSEEEEESIVSFAGQIEAVTIATQMAARGTDISVSQASVEQGGLYVIIAEYHESPRLDIQAEGRAARHGDPGCSRFFCSIEDDLFTKGIKAKVLGFYRGLLEGEAYVEFKPDSILSTNLKEIQLTLKDQFQESRKHSLLVDKIVDPYRTQAYELRELFVTNTTESVTKGLKELADIYLEELQVFSSSRTLYQIAMQMSSDLIDHGRSFERVASAYGSQLSFVFSPSSLERAFDLWRKLETEAIAGDPSMLSFYILEELLQTAQKADIAYVNEQWNTLVTTFQLDASFEPILWNELYRHLNKKLNLGFGWQAWERIEYVLKEKVTLEKHEPRGISELVRKSILEVLEEQNANVIAQEAILKNKNDDTSEKKDVVAGVNIWEQPGLLMTDTIAQAYLDSFNNRKGYRKRLCQKIVEVFDEIWIKTLDEIRLTEMRVQSEQFHKSAWSVLLLELGKLLRNAIADIAHYSINLLEDQDFYRQEEEKTIQRWLPEESLGTKWLLYQDKETVDSSDIEKSIVEKQVEKRLEAYRDEQEIYTNGDTSSDAFEIRNKPTYPVNKQLITGSGNGSLDYQNYDREALQCLRQIDAFLSDDEVVPHSETTLEVARNIFYRQGGGLTAAKLLDKLDKLDAAQDYIAIYKAFGCRTQQLSYLELLEREGSLPIHLRIYMTDLLADGDQDERRRAKQMLSSETFLQELTHISSGETSRGRFHLREILSQLSRIQAYDEIVEVFTKTMHILCVALRDPDEQKLDLRFHMIYRIIGEALRKGSSIARQQINDFIGFSWREWLNNVILGLYDNLESSKEISYYERIAVYKTLLTLACYLREPAYAEYFSHKLLELDNQNYTWMSLADLYEEAECQFEAHLCRGRYCLLEENYEDALGELTHFDENGHDSEVKALQLYAHLGLARVHLPHLYGKRIGSRHLDECIKLGSAIFNSQDILGETSPPLVEILFEAFCLKEDFPRVEELAFRVGAHNSHWYTRAWANRMMGNADTLEKITHILEDVVAETPAQQLEICRAFNKWIPRFRKHHPSDWKRPEVGLLIDKMIKEWELLLNVLGNYEVYWELGLLKQWQGRWMYDNGDSNASSRLGETVELWKIALNYAQETTIHRPILRRHERLIREEIEESLRKCLQFIKSLESGMSHEEKILDLVDG